MDLSFIFDYLSSLQKIDFFEFYLIIITYIYLHLPLPVTAILIFNSIYFKEFSFLINLVLINTSYISCYKAIHFLKINDLVNKFIFQKIHSLEKINFEKNQFSFVFILRLLIPIPLLNYFLSIRNFNIKKTSFITLISLIPYIYLITGSSKNFIDGRGFDYKFLSFYIIYALIIILTNKFLISPYLNKRKLNEKN